MAKKKQTPKEREYNKRDRRYQKAYGISIETYNKLLKSQKYRCAICNKPNLPTDQHFDIDHNHKTGHVRGLLCSYCNRSILRFFRDNKVIAKGLVKYLSRALKEDKLWKERVRW